MAISRAYRKGKQSTKTNKKPTVHRHIAEGGRVCNLATDALLFAPKKSLSAAVAVIHTPSMHMTPPDPLETMTKEIQS